MSIGERLLGVPQPIPHESIFGWILRLADDHQVSVGDVLRAARLYDVRTDVDFGLNATGWAELSAFATLPADSFVHARALRAGLATRPSIAPLVLRKCPDGKPCYAFCPDCMRSNGVKHLPIEWRLRQLRVCPRHFTWLATRCHRCDSHLTLEKLVGVRNETTKRRRIPLGVCPVCRKPLRAPVAGRRLSTDPQGWIELQQAVLASIVHGYCRIDGIRRKFSVDLAIAIDDWKGGYSNTDASAAESLVSRIETYPRGQDEASFLRRLFQLGRRGYGYECRNYILEHGWASSP